MLPQHGGVPSFSMRIKGPVLALLILVLVTGTLLTISFHLHTDPGDLAAQNRANLSLIITLMLSFFILLVGTGRWWYPHLWRRGNSQKHHRHRRNHSHSSLKRR